MKRQRIKSISGSEMRRVASAMPIRVTILAFISLAVLAAVPAAALAAPSATSAAATNVHHTSAVLRGHLDPDTDPGVTACSFEWGPTTSYGNTAPCSEGNSFTSPADVSAGVNNLTPGVTYHFRLSVETTANGTISGSDQSFRPDTFPITHPDIASFGPDGTSASTFVQLFGIAFNQSAQRLYTFDRSADAIYGFDATSPSYSPLTGFNPLAVPGKTEQDQPDIAVDNTALPSAGNIYYVPEANFAAPFEPDEYNIYGYSPTGSPLPGFPVRPLTGRGCGGAVDSAGHLWVGNHTNQVEEFSSAGVRLGSVALPEPGNLCKLAFDTNDDIFVVGQNGSIWKYTSASGYTSGSEFAPRANNNVVIDASTHNVFVSHYAGGEGTTRYPEGERIDEYDSAGHFLGEFSIGTAPGTAHHVTIDSVNHRAFVEGTDKKIHVFDLGSSTTVKLPTVTTGEASAITPTSATLEGQVDPEGMPVTECHFAWGLSSQYTNTAPCSPMPGSGSGDVEVSTEISGLQPNTGYYFRVFASNAEGTTAQKEGRFTTPSAPSASTAPVSGLTNESADLNGLVNPKGAATTYHFEWGTTTAYGNSVPVPDGDAGSGSSNAAVSAHLSGLAPNTRYHYRILAQSVNGTSTSGNASFITLGAPIAETTGAPIRTTESAQLGGRVIPNGFPTGYYFEYGDQGPCDVNPCAQTSSSPAGSGEFSELVSEEVEGLQPDTTYHYRLIADNGQPGSPVIGEDMTVTTRSSEAPLSHGRFPGPPGSDRAWEQMSLAQNGGNSVDGPVVISDDGNRAVWGLAGGAPITDTGGFSEHYSERTPNGWQVRVGVFPSRSQLAGPNWNAPIGDSELLTFTAHNWTIHGAHAVFAMTVGEPSKTLYEAPIEAEYRRFDLASEDGSRVLSAVESADFDPAHPVAPNNPNLYDVTTPGSPRLVGYLPGNTIPACGIVGAAFGGTTPYVTPAEGPNADDHWISPDGEVAFFMSQGNACSSQPQLYLRDFGAEETTLISGPPVSGPECGASFVKATPGEAFFWSKTRLVAEDTATEDCDAEKTDGDIYRYDLAAGDLECVTCVVDGVDADVLVKSTPASSTVAVAEDGSRAYFLTGSRLLPGAKAPGVYRVDVDSGDLAYVGSFGVSFGDQNLGKGAYTPDGSLFFFRSGDPSLNPLGAGSGNAGTKQFYRYDDEDRSLVCVSCPQDGSAPRGDVKSSEANEDAGSHNVLPISDEGSFAFSTPTRLVPADQNTAPAGQDPIRGADAYEWRNGRLLLVTDGLTDWTGGASGTPDVRGMTPSGKDVLFTAAAQYTPDALNDFIHLYDARVGGGFDFPKPPPTCPLEVCQGTPKGVPEEAAPGTRFFEGPGNVGKPPARAKCGKGKSRRKGRCVAKKPKRAKHSQRRANHDRRNAR